MQGMGGGYAPSPPPPMGGIGMLMQAPLELVGLGSSSSMDSFASWKMNGSGMVKGREREETPLQGEDESRRNSPP